MMAMKISLEQAANYLLYQGVGNAFREAELLMMDLMGVSSRSALSGLTLSAEDKKLFWLRVKQRGQRQPSAYIHGNVVFYNLSLYVDKTVLIPRQETELLAEQIVRYIRSCSNIRLFYDVCCGSGCLGLSIKKACPEVEVVLSDICPKALYVAKRNALSNGLSVEFLEGDLFDPFSCPADAFVCNPPYLSFSEIFKADPEVRCHEPWKALVGGKTGYEFYERIASNIDKILVRGGVGWLEIGHAQGVVVKKMFDKRRLPCTLYRDYAGLDRFFFLENEPYDTLF